MFFFRDFSARRRRSGAPPTSPISWILRAAFLAQKCVVEFCRVRAGVYWQKLFSEQEFQTALDHSRWQAYPPCYAMVAEVVEGALRETAGMRQRGLPAALEKLARRSFAKYPVPGGSSESFWENAAELVRERLAVTQAGAPAAGAGDSGPAGADGLRNVADPPRPADQRL